MRESRVRQQLNHGTNAINQRSRRDHAKASTETKNSLLSPRGCHTTQLMIHGQQEITHHLTIETDASACFPSPRIDNSPRLRSCQIRPDQKVHRAGVATSASRETVECKVEHLKDGAKGNARQTKTNKVGVLIAC